MQAAGDSKGKGFHSKKRYVFGVEKAHKGRTSITLQKKPGEKTHAMLGRKKRLWKKAKGSPQRRPYKGEEWGHRGSGEELPVSFRRDLVNRKGKLSMEIDGRKNGRGGKNPEYKRPARGTL